LTLDQAPLAPERREHTMHCDIRAFGLAVVATLALPAFAAAQQPPKNEPPVAPKAEQLESKDCAHADTRSTTGKGGETAQEKPSNGNLSDKLARSGGVICPPDQMDPEIKAPTPPGGGSMPVIPPPGSPGGDRNVQPK
jgi:hypothetical protein